jgi:hypothetical protein
MAAMASTVRGMRVVYHKGGTAPCKCHAVSSTAAHHCQRVHQRRRTGSARRLRGVARKAGAACADRPGRSKDRLHNRTGEDTCPERSDRNANAHLKRQIMGREVVVAVTNSRLDFGTWERIFSDQAEWLARES